MCNLRSEFRAPLLQRVRTGEDARATTINCLLVLGVKLRNASDRSH